MSAGLHRFFVTAGQFSGERAAHVGEHLALRGEQAHQISRVLRLKAGDRLILLDGDGWEYRVRLDEVRSSAVTGAIESIHPSRPEPRLHLTLYQALVLRDRFETVLQKGTEVGISRFVPVWCERSIVPRGDQIDERRLERWRRIVTEAAEQCERGRVPEVAPAMRFGPALAEAAAGPALLAWEREDARSLREGLRAAVGGTGQAALIPLPPLPQAPLKGVLNARLRPPRPPLPQAGEGEQVGPSAREVCADGRGREGGAMATLALFVGPEGGFSPTEVEAARAAGVHTVSLGPRILRTETAGPVLAALALYEAGDMEPNDPDPDSAVFVAEDTAR